jgi:hypothetical protein
VGLWSGRKRRFILMSGVENVVGRGMRRGWEVERMGRMGMEREMVEMGRGIERGVVRKGMEAEAGELYRTTRKDKVGCNGGEEGLYI